MSDIPSVLQSEHYDLPTAREYSIKHDVNVSEIIPESILAQQVEDALNGKFKSSQITQINDVRTWVVV